ncbi:MAG: AEC family transporter [Deferribacterales bacterium]
MDSLVLLIFCFLFGMVARKLELLPSSTPIVLNNFIINLSMPAITFLFIHRMEFDTSLLFPVFMPWIHFALAFGIFYMIAKWKKYDRKMTGTMILTAGLGNTSFVGFPLITAYYGAEYLGVGVLCDQPGSFLVLSTLGIATAAYYSSGSVSPLGLLKKVFTFPPFQAMLLAVLLRSFEIPWWAESSMKTLGLTITPLAMVSVGYQLKLVKSGGIINKLFFGLGYKLFLAPAFFYVLYVLILGGAGKNMQVTLFESAMAPMITAGIVSIQYGLDEDLAVMMLGVGIPLSLLTTPIWYYLFSGV